jgi:hypothetical protein
MNIPVTSNMQQQSLLNKQRKDKFVMVFNIPEVLKIIKSDISRANNKVIPNTVQFSIYGTIIPDISIPEKEVPYGGQVLKVSSMARPSYPNNVINFTIDNMFNNYWVIYKWLEVLNQEKESVYKSKIPLDKGSLKNYETTITVFGLDEYNNRVIQFNFYHCFPVKLGGIQYSDRDPGELESTFEFAYHQLEATLL